VIGSWNWAQEKLIVAEIFDEQPSQLTAARK
jgi:hypothetical protein